MLPLQGAWVQSLVRDLRSHKLHQKGGREWGWAIIISIPSLCSCSKLTVSYKTALSVSVLMNWSPLLFCSLKHHPFYTLAFNYPFWGPCLSYLEPLLKRGVIGWTFPPPLSHLVRSERPTWRREEPREDEGLSPGSTGWSPDFSDAQGFHTQNFFIIIM